MFRRLVPARRFSRVRAGILVLGLIISLGAGVAALHNAWHETLRREAYLPDLEEGARRSLVDGRLLALLGGRLIEAKEYEAAAQALERAVAAGQGKAVVWLTWSAATAAAGDRVRAGAVLQLGMRDPSVAPVLRAALDRCRPLGPAPSLAALADAICPGGTGPIRRAYAAGSFLNAVAEWHGQRNPDRSGFATRERWARERPGDARAQILWARALLRNRRVPEALAAVSRAVELAGPSPEAHLALGDVYFAGGAFAKAGLEYKQCLRLRPDWLPALLGLGSVAVEKKLIAMGVENFERATKIAPRSPDAWIGLGRAHVNQRLRFDLALRAFETAARLAPDRTDFFAYYSDALRANYRPDEAEALLRRRLRAEPGDARAHYLLGLALLDNKPTPAREAAAERAFRTALDLDPDRPAARLRLGQLLLARGKPEEAAAQLQSVLQADAYNHSAMQALARAYRRMGRTREAEAADRRAAALARYAQRLAELTDEENRNPLNPRVHRALAALYAERGQENQARTHREMAWMLERNKTEASKALSSLNAARNFMIGAQDLPSDKAAVQSKNRTQRAEDLPLAR